MTLVDAFGYGVVVVAVLVVILTIVSEYLELRRDQRELEDLMYRKFKYDNHEAFGKTLVEPYKKE